jgi:hypothetical protein
MTDDLFTAALSHVNAGRPVFPCWPDKTPKTTNGFHDASRAQAQLAEWFYKAPDTLLAIPTGAVSGLVVLDVDDHESLRDLFDRMPYAERIEYGGQLPRTASVKTPRGGAHYYFQYPGIEVRCSASKLAPDIDVRGDGGYVIVPPSAGYVVDEECAAAAMPRWLRGAVAVHPTVNSYRTDPAEWIALVRDGVGEGQRNDSLARVVGHLLRNDVDVNLVTEIARLVNRHRFRPPLDDAEVDRVVASIAGAELRRRGK